MSVGIRDSNCNQLNLKLETRTKKVICDDDCLFRIILEARAAQTLIAFGMLNFMLVSSEIGHYRV